MTSSRGDGRSDRYPGSGSGYGYGPSRSADPGYGPRGRSEARSDGYGRGFDEPTYREPGRIPRRDFGRGGPPGRGGAGGSGDGSGKPPFNVGTAALLAGVLVVGIGIGSAVTSTTQGNQGNIASSQQLDMAVPDPEF